MMKGWSSAQTLPKCSGHENASVMKGEAGSSNLPGSTMHLSSRARRAPDRAAQRAGDHLVAWRAINSSLTSSTILFALSPSGHLGADTPTAEIPNRTATRPWSLVGPFHNSRKAISSALSKSDLFIGLSIVDQQQKEQTYQIRSDLFPHASN